MSRQLMSVLVLAFLALYLEQTAGWSYYCQMGDIVGTWTIKRSLDTTDDFVHCWGRGSSQTLSHTIQLSYPDVASDEYGNYGHWTSIYGIALEITIHGRKYYTFFDWSWEWHRGWDIDCNTLEIGQSRDILTNNYACFTARKGTRAENDVADPDPEPSTYPPHPPTFDADPKFKKDPTPTNVPTDERHPQMAIDPSLRHEKFQIDFDLVNSINRNDIKLWEAHPYDFLKDITNEDLIMMAGGNMSTRGRPPKPAPRTEEQLKKSLSFPRSFDWRDVDGKNYVSSVRNQGYCGSCYAFAAAAAFESRMRIMTDNTFQPIVSPQDVVNCSPYTYGCWGGWIFTEGKYGEEFGFVDEMCEPYSGETERCERDPTCQRYYSTDYQYVGGYFGGSNDLLMQDAIYNNGPLVVGFAVYLDFIYYRRGVYYHSGPDRLLGYHAVAVVGWGQDERSGTKYWIVKNSWGRNWGEDGYFRIVRGANDCDLEAEAFEAFPIL